MCSYLKDQELSNFKTSTQESFSVWFSLIRYSLVGLLDLIKVGEKIRCRLSMTTAIQLRTLLSAPTLSTFSSRKALHGPNQYLSAMIEVFVSIEYSSASLSLKVQQSRLKNCRSYLWCYVLNTSCLGKMKCIGQSTNLTESNAAKRNIMRVAHPFVRPGSIKMRCSVSLTLGLFSSFAKEIPSNSLWPSQISMASSSGSSGIPLCSLKHPLSLLSPTTKIGRKVCSSSTVLRKSTVISIAFASSKTPLLSGMRQNITKDANYLIWLS